MTPRGITDKLNSSEESSRVLIRCGSLAHSFCFYFKLALLGAVPNRDLYAVFMNVKAADQHAGVADAHFALFFWSKRPSIDECQRSRFIPNNPIKHNGSCRRRRSA